MKYHEIKSVEEFDNLIEHYNKEDYDYLALDTECTGLNRITDRVISISITGSNSRVAYFAPIELCRSLSNCRRKLILHNWKFDYHMLRASGIDLEPSLLLYDTIYLDHLLNENDDHSLDAIVKRRYNDNYKELFWGKYKEYTDAPREEQIEYACKDVLYTDKICQDILKDLRALDTPNSLIEHVHALARCLYETEKEGILVDLPYTSKVGDELSTKIKTLLTEVRSSVDLQCQQVENELYEKELDKRKTAKGKANVKRPSFNFDSSSQLSRLIYDVLKLPPQFNKDRTRTTKDEALAELENYHPAIAKLREYRGHQKVFTSFIEGTLEKVSNGKVYPTFNPCGTVTGRISHSEPNLGQLPAKGGIRGIYIPKKGYRFISLDYEMLEVSLAAHFSRDRALLSIINEGCNQHDITAEGLGIPRSLAKPTNFALQYGAGIAKIQAILGCTWAEAEAAFQRYWDTYSGLRDFNQRCHEQIERGEPLINPFGRRRHFPTLKEVKEQYPGNWYNKKTDTLVERYRGPWERILRQAPNSLIQGTGADCTNRAFYLIDDILQSKGYGRALFTVHDEVLLEVLEKHVDESSKIAKDIMVGVGEEIKLTVPLRVSVSEGMSRWLD